MQITILDYVTDVRNNKIGNFDIRINYTNEKFEIFRNIGYFIKGNKKWITFPSVKRSEKWFLLYERSNSESMKEIISETLKAIEDYLLAHSIRIPESSSLR